MVISIGVELKSNIKVKRRHFFLLLKALYEFKAFDKDVFVSGVDDDADE